MTTESGSDSESKDKEQDQEESPAQEGAAETQQQDQQQPQPQQPQQQPSEEHQTALEQFSAVAAHSTPVRKEQVGEPKHTRSLHATGCVPTYCSWEITSLARLEWGFIFRFAWKAV